MNLPVPIVSIAPGPEYAQDVNDSLTLVDAHDHSLGSGVQITPAGMNINDTLSLQNNFLTNIAGLTLTAQGSTPGIGTIYESGVDLYYVDGLGNNVRITQSGGVAGSPGSISNLTSPASASYVAGTSTFVWQSNTNIAANMDFGSAILRNLSPNSTFGLTLAPPTLGSDYTLTLPTIPASESFVTLTNVGIFNATIPKANGITASNIANATITTTQIASATILGSNIANATITGSNIAANTIDISNLNISRPTQQTFTSTGTQTGWLFTISTSSTVAVGDTYTNNANTYTVLYALTAQSGQVLWMSGTGATSGTTLTRATGSGTVSITFSVKIAIATYTTPTSPAAYYLKVRMAGGGGGGTDGSSAVAGTNTRFGGPTNLSALGGTGASGTTVGVGGTASLGTGGAIGIATTGGTGMRGVDGTTLNIGGPGGSNSFSGSGGAGTAGIANTGGGGGGRDASTGTGGGAGGTVDAIINSPAAVYYYVVGTGGAAGGAGGNGVGAAGVIYVQEFYI